MKRKKNSTGIVMELVWSSDNMAIYKDSRVDEHVLYKSGESIFNAKTFDEVYGQSMKIRNLKV